MIVHSCNPFTIIDLWLFGSESTCVHPPFSKTLQQSHPNLLSKDELSLGLFCNLTEMLCDECNPARCECFVCKTLLPVTQKPNLPQDKTALCSFEQISNHQSLFLYLQHPCFFIFYKHKHYFNESVLQKSEQPINQTHKKLKSLHREVC